MENFIPWYPSIKDENIREIIWNKREFFELNYITNKNKNNNIFSEESEVNKSAKSFLYPHQIFIKRYISPITPYTGLVLFHNTGSGKTFSSIAVCESHKHIMSKALIIVKGNTSYINFRDQIIKWYKAKGYDLNEIKKYYEIRKYISFSNIIKKLTDQQLKNRFNNKIIVIDEVHNLRSLDFQEQITDINTEYKQKKQKHNEEQNTESTNHLIYNQMWRLLHNINNSKTLLLTATPMIDKAEEIYSIMNLILEKDNQLTGTLSLEKLEKKIKGRISYLKSNEEMAEIKEQGIILPGCNIKVIPSTMKNIQLYTYKKIDIKNVSDHVYRNSVYCSLMTLKDGSYGAKAFENNIIKKKDIHGKPVFIFHETQRKLITRKTLHIFSCKYAKMIEIIEKSENELVFVFCEEVRGSGIIMIGCVLEALGYSQYNGEELSQIDKKLRYTIYTGDPSVCPNPEERLHGFRSKSNKYGEYIKILIGSRVSGEGISLTNIRQVHIITPHWNISTVIQAIGRAVRRDSHHMLKETERQIKIYRHVAIADESYENIKTLNQEYISKLYTPKISIDMYKYKISEEKENLIKKVEQKMSNESIDYYLNVECEHETKHHSKQIPKDISSYLITYTKTNLEKYPTFDHIEKLFEKTPILDIKNIDIENELLSIIIGEKITTTNNKRLRLYGNKICIESENYVHKKITLEEYWKNILEKETLLINYTNNILEKKAINYFSKYSQKELINIIMSLNIDIKIKLLELSIIERALPLINLFYNSMTKINGKWYHIMLYRAYEDKFSYSVSSEKFIISGRTKKLDIDDNNNKKWIFVNVKEEEEKVINTIKTKIKDSKNPMEKLGIYGVISTTDSKFRIRNIAFEDDKEKSKKDNKDMRKINRGRYIDSYSLSEMRSIATYLFNNQINYSYINSQPTDNFNTKDITTFIENNKSLQNQIFKIPKNKKCDFKLLYWIITKKKRELKNIIINTLIDNNMYIIL
jgi:Helicase conserved C-terminal domain/SNF2-related domain